MTSSAPKSSFDTTLTPDPICPACGHRHQDAWEWSFGPGLDGSVNRECEECGAEFKCERIVTVDYTTRLVQAPSGDKP